MSDEEALLITESADLPAAADRLLSETTATFAITMGKEGALLGHEGRLKQVEAIPVNPVDTTGAGDAFVGATLFQLQEKETIPRQLDDWSRIIANANRAGARTCEFLGAMEAFRQLNQNILTV